ncbi:MAG: M23 family metallopeptidase [Acidimicrobiales bacterium]
MPPCEPPRRASSRTVGALVVVGALVAMTVTVGAAGGPAAAQPPSSPTTVPTVATPTTAPASPPVTGPDGAPVPTTTAVDPLTGSSEGLSGGAYAAQPPFDPSSELPLVAEVSAARKRLATAKTRWQQAQAAVDASVSKFQDLADRIVLVGKNREEQVAGAVASKANLRRRAVQAFIRGDQSVNLLGIVGDATEYSRANRYLETAAGMDRDALSGYEARIADMNQAERDLVDAQSAVEREVSDLSAERDRANDAVLAAQRCLTARQMGSRLCVDTFVFPVLGEVNFIDSWGFARLPGTVDQHWHEGTDIMAPTGREIVAVENGTLFKVGDAGLGGLRLWLHGDSGTDYYYAHFSSFAPDSVDGALVSAGTVVGYAGNTGDAAGGASHLHFEIHPSGGAPVSPFPLLKATWGVKRPMLLEREALEGIPSAAVTLPAEER